MLDLSVFKDNLLFEYQVLTESRGAGNSTVVSVSVCQAGGPGSRLPRSACVRKVEFYHCVIDSFPPVLTIGLKKAIHVLLSVVRVGHCVPLAGFCLSL